MLGLCPHEERFTNIQQCLLRIRALFAPYILHIATALTIPSLSN